MYYSLGLDHIIMRNEGIHVDLNSVLNVLCKVGHDALEMWGLFVCKTH